MKISKVIKVNLIIGYTMSAIMTVMMAIGGGFENHIFSEFFQIVLPSQIEAILVFFVVGFMIFLMVCFICSPIFIVKALLKSKDVINKKYVDTKESIYTRELPEYNSAIAGELFDLKSNFENEYIAGVMELISKGYLIENENEIVIDSSKSIEGLLKNEKYILNTCTDLNFKITSIEWNEFYKELKEDMYDLGLYNRGDFLKDLKNNISEDKKISRFINEYTLKNIIIPAFLIISYFTGFLPILLLFFMCVIFIKKRKITKKGELEKEKIGKLKLFLERETNFKEKKEEERLLWGRYSAFAVALGLNTEMKEDIYGKIIKKSNI